MTAAECEIDKNALLIAMAATAPQEFEGLEAEVAGAVQVQHRPRMEVALRRREEHDCVRALSRRTDPTQRRLRFDGISVGAVEGLDDGGVGVGDGAGGHGCDGDPCAQQAR